MPSLEYSSSSSLAAAISEAATSEIISCVSVCIACSPLSEDVLNVSEFFVISLSMFVTSPAPAVSLTTTFSLTVSGSFSVSIKSSLDSSAITSSFSATAEIALSDAPTLTPSIVTTSPFSFTIFTSPLAISVFISALG